MAHEIFISYSHKDKAVADAICNHLENDGMRCWYAPRDIAPGDEWGSAIVKGIEASKVMVLVFTPDSNLSQQVLREVNNAVSAGVTIIPFRLTEEEPTGGMRYYLAAVHWLDAMNQDLEESIQELSVLCRAIIDKTPYTGKPAATDAAKAVTTPAAPAGKKSNKKTIIIAAIAAAILAIVGLIFALGGGDKDTTGSGGSDNSGTSGGSVKYEETLDIGATSGTMVEDMDCTYTTGNMQGNIQNGGYMAYDGEWYYYRSNDKNKMYRMHADGSDKTKLTDIPAECINIYHDSVYFSSEGNGFYKMNKDGSDLTCITESFLDGARIVNDRIYHGIGALCSMNLDGNDIVTEWDDLGVYWCTDGTYVYYTDPDRGGHLYRAVMGGDEELCIFDHNVQNLCIAGKYLFFLDNNENYDYYKYDLTTGEVSLAVKDVINEPTITKDGIYGYAGEDGRVTYYSFDGTEEKELSDVWSDYINVMGGKAFYRNTDDGKYYMVNTDGTDTMEL